MSSGIMGILAFPFPALQCSAFATNYIHQRRLAHFTAPRARTSFASSRGFSARHDSTIMSTKKASVLGQARICEDADIYTSLFVSRHLSYEDERLGGLVFNVSKEEGG